MTVETRNSSTLRNRLLAALFFIILNAGLTFAYVTDSTIYTPPAYTTFVPPAAGGSYTDAVFGTAIKRLTDSMSMTRADNGATLASVQTEYSTMSPFNQDNTRLLLLHFSYFGLYDGAGNYLKDLPLEINASSEPRWSRKDPNVLYYHRGNQLKQYNVGTGAMAVVHTFTQYTQIRGNGESDISEDGDHLVLQGDGWVFVYTISTDTAGPAFDTAGRGFDSLYITPNNNVTITWNTVGTSRYTGIELFDQNMNFLRQVTHADGHMDVTRDVNGDEVLVWTNSADATPLVNCPNGIVKVRLADARQTCMLAIGWIGVAVHISAPDNAGWVLVDAYAPSDPIPPTTGWKLYTNELLLVRLDGSEVRRIAHHRSRPFNSYTYMPRVSVNRDGSKAVYSSNYGLQAQLAYPSNYSDAYMIDLSATSPTVPPLPPPTGQQTTTRVEESASAVTYTGAWNNNSLTAHSGGAAKLAISAGYSATFSFTGTGANWIAYTDQWSGFAKVYIDGVLQGEIDTYASPAKAQAKVFGITGLRNDAHTLTIEVSGRRNTSSGGNWVWVDAFEASTTSVQAAQATIAWAVPADIVYGTALGSMQLNASATVNGNAISGAFVYTPAAGTVLQAGSGQTLHVDFSPTDATLYRGASQNVTITVTKSGQTIAFAPLANKTYGDPPFTITGVASSSLPLAFSASGACAVSGNNVTLTGSGSCDITAHQTGNTNYAAALDVTQSFVVSAIRTAITWPTPSDVTYGTALDGVQLNATASMNGSFVYTPGAGTVLQAGSGQTLHVDFVPADSINYIGASKDVTINVLKAGQTITFGPLTNKVYGDPSFSVNAVASSDLPVTLSASGACTVSGATVAIIAAGSCSITAQQPGDRNYTAAADVSQSFTVAKAASHVTWPSPSDISYGVALGASQLNATSSVNGSFFYAPGAGEVLQAGSGQRLHVDFIPADSNNAGASLDVSINVLKANQTMSFGALANKTFGDPPFTVSATASSSLPVSFAAAGSCTVVGTTVTLTSTGVCTITANQVGDNNYLAAANVSQSFTVSTAAQLTTQRIEQTSTAVQFSGSWNANNLWAHSGHSARLAMNIGDKTTLTFAGTDVTWVAYRDQWSGIARVYVDGVLSAIVDTYLPTGKAQAPMYTVSGLPLGTHTLTIEVTGQKNASSAGRWVWVDAFDVGTR